MATLIWPLSAAACGPVSHPAPRGLGILRDSASYFQCALGQDRSAVRSSPHDAIELIQSQSPENEAERKEFVFCGQGDATVMARAKKAPSSDAASTSRSRGRAALCPSRPRRKEERQHKQKR